MPEKTSLPEQQFVKILCRNLLDNLIKTKKKLKFRANYSEATFKE